MRELRFIVAGRPAPQGSKNAYVIGKRAVMVEASKYLPEWRAAVMSAAQIAMLEAEEIRPFTEPVKLVVTFFIERPAKPKHERYPGSKPDLDHLIRAVGDSLTQAGVLQDDALIVEVIARKYWTGTTTNTYPVPGASVYVATV